MTKSTLAGDEAAWLDQYSLLWGEHDYPDSALLHVSSKGDFVGRRVPLDDPDAAWAYATQRRFTDIYVRVAPLNGDHEYAPGARGKKVDSLALPALWLDVDCAHGVHGSEALPTAKQAGRIVRGILAPSLIIGTGGGVHCYWALDEPLDWTTPEGDALLQQWASMWKRTFAEHEFEVDSGVSKDVGRILRMAGTYNGKTDPVRPVRTLERDPYQTYTSADILAVSPVDVREEIMRTATAGARRLSGPQARRTNRLLDVTSLMEAVWGLEPLGGDRWSLPYPDGSHNPTGSAQVWEGEHEGDTAVTAFSDRLQRLWGQPDEAHSLRAWDLLVIAFGGDRDFAELIVDSLRHDPDRLIDTAATYWATHAPAALTELSTP